MATSVCCVMITLVKKLYGIKAKVEEIEVKDEELELVETEEED